MAPVAVVVAVVAAALRPVVALAAAALRVAHLRVAAAHLRLLLLAHRQLPPVDKVQLQVAVVPALLPQAELAVAVPRL